MLYIRYLLRKFLKFEEKKGGEASAIAPYM
jgi:hypothetical protein